MRPASKVIAVVLWVMSATAVAQTQIYESKDKSGAPVFSDVPSAGSREVTLPPPNISDAPMPSVQKQAPAPSPAYSQLSIESPAQEGTIHTNTGEFKISVNVDPALNSQRGDRFLVKLDGTTLPQRYASTTIDITTQDFAGAALHTTEHRLEVTIVDATGKVLIAATPVKFFVHRASVGRSRR